MFVHMHNCTVDHLEGIWKCRTVCFSSLQVYYRYLCTKSHICTVTRWTFWRSEGMKCDVNSEFVMVIPYTTLIHLHKYSVFTTSELIFMICKYHVYVSDQTRCQGSNVDMSKGRGWGKLINLRNGLTCPTKSILGQTHYTCTTVVLGEYTVHLSHNVQIRSVK